MVPEPPAQAERAYQIVDGHIPRCGRRFAARIETEYITKHTQEPGIDHVPPLRKQCIQRRQSVFQPSVIHADTKAHAAFLDRYVEIAKQAGKVGVIGVIEYDEAGVDRYVPIDTGQNGSGVPAKARL